MTVPFMMTASEAEAVEELKRRVVNDIKDEMYDDNYLFYRFLKARDFDITQAENMLRKSLEWRKKNHVDTILTDYKPPEVCKMFLVQTLFGFDNEGSPIRYVPVGNLDTRGLFMSAKFTDIEKSLIHMVEFTMNAVKQQTEKLGRQLGGFVNIYNLENLSLAKATDRKGLELLIYLSKCFQDNYPEQLKAMYVINAPMYFTIPYSIIKPFLSRVLLNKIKIFGTDDWKKELLKITDAETLPVFLGGNRTDPDGNPLCKTIFNHGGVVPEKYYMHKRKRSLGQAPGVQHIVLSRASFSELSLKVEEPESLIEWEFETRTRDIGFGLFYREDVDGVGRNRVLIPLQRIDTEEYSETGMYKCEKAGNYVILFDNTHSWIRAKEVFYRIIVTSPKEHEERVSEEKFRTSQKSV